MNQRDLIRGLIQTVVWLVVLAALPVGALYFTARPVVVAGCPQCFGFSKAGDGVYIQSGASAAVQAHVEQVLAAGRKRVVDFYGSLQHTPRFLVCPDDACYTRIGGMPGTSMGAVDYFAVVVSPQGLDPTPLAAAFSHAELEARVGWWHMKSGAVPAWFDAGVAALASDNPAYVLPLRRGQKDRCQTGPGGDLPDESDLWQAR
ncbi:MAG TPA: hypothetical protein VGM16_01330, partial [Gammaproteobacteria bacterium]